MHLAQQGAGCPIGIEPPLAETDHLWWERFTHETSPGLQEPSYYSTYIYRIRCWGN